MARPRKRAEVPTEIYFSEYDQRWHGYVTVGRRGNGTPDRRHRSGKTYEIVEEKLRELLDQVAAKKVPKVGRGPTVEDWFTTWLTVIAPFGDRPLSENTLTGYWSLCRTWIFPHMGALRLVELETDTDSLDGMYAAMYQAGLARSSVLKCHAVLRRGLGVAKQRGKIGHNPVRDLDNPGSTKPRRRARRITQEQAERLLEILGTHPNGLRWRIALAIGPRQGEMLGLRWPYVDLKNGEVSLDWQIQRQTYRHGCPDPAACVVEHELCRPRRRPCAPRREHGCDDPAACHPHRADLCPQVRSVPHTCREHRRWPCPPPHPPGCAKHADGCPKRVGGLVLTRAKTVDPSQVYEDDDEDDALYDEDQVEEAIHLVALPKSITKELRLHKAAQEVHAERVGELWHNLDLVFCQSDGRPIDPGMDYRELRQILRSAGIRSVGTHGVRRTAATLLLEMGAELAVVQEMLGHTDPRTTRRYTRVSVGLTRRAARAMDRGLLARKPKKAKKSDGGKPVA